MKKLTVVLLSSFLLLQNGIDVSASENSHGGSRESHAPLKMEKGYKAIEYLPEEEVYFLNNVTIEEVIKAFDESPDYIQSDEPMLVEHLSRAEVNNLQDIVVNKGFDTYNNNVSLSSAAQIQPFAVSKDYYLSTSIKGINNQYVTIQWGITVTMKVVKYNGVNYDMFVSITDNSGLGLSSGEYKIESKGQVNTSITNGGATLNVNQFLQLQTTSTYSSSVTIGEAFVKVGASVGGSYYYRTDLRKFSASKNLPLINVVK